jgi:hypothetical protein
VVIYPKELSQLEQVLNAKVPNIDSEDGHPIAYSAILQAVQSYERLLVFLKEDYDQITKDPTWSELVPIWMNTAAKVATGNRQRVLEDGPDKMNSDDDEDAIEDVRPDEELGMYTAGMDPKKGPVMLTPEQAAAQKAAVKITSRSQTPVGGSSDDNDPNGSENVWSQSRGYFRKNKYFRKPVEASPMTSVPESTTSDPESSAMGSIESTRQPTPINSDDDDSRSEDQKRMADLGKKMARRGAKKPVPEEKASKPTEGRESPETKVSKPMETRRQAASRAGGLRGVVGSGSTGYACDKSSPSSKPGS